MNKLDNLFAINKLDCQQVAESLTLFPEQLISGWQSSKAIKLPSTYKKNTEIIFCGMGGSNLASEMLRDIYGTKIIKPIILVRNYNLPSFASNNSLIIISSYSGNTEETISCLKQAIKIKAKIIVITSGGKILTIAKKNNLPIIKIDTKLNPSQQPRYGLGLQLGAILELINNLEEIKLDEKNFKNSCQRIKIIETELLPVIKKEKNIAKQLALSLTKKIIFITAGEHLKSNAHILANQINESAKQLAMPFHIPELNHHLLEAFSYPSQVIKNCLLLSLTSPLYEKKIQKRFFATGKIFHQLKIKHLILESSANNYLDSALEILIYGSWVSFYLAILNNKNPASIPWVESFKKELKT